jgi:ABC-type multidrug transport system permease subunit
VFLSHLLHTKSSTTVELTCANFCRERANGCYGAFTYSFAALLVALPFIFLLSVAAGSICYGCLQLNDKEGRFFLFIVNLFVTLAVAESVIALISTIVPFFIVGIAAGAFTFGGFMVVEGFFIKVEDIPPGWRWMHWIAFHSYSFANFMYIEFDGRIIGLSLFLSHSPTCSSTCLPFSRILWPSHRVLCFSLTQAPTSMLFRRLLRTSTVN